MLKSIGAFPGAWGVGSFHALPAVQTVLIEAPNQSAVEAATALADLCEQVCQLSSMVRDLHDKAVESPVIDPKARYPLAKAAKYLETSASTLKRRASAGKLAILYDGKTPFVTGAELLRYAREGATRRERRKRARK